MSDKIDDGGAAFPVSTIDDHTNEGMTLRDYFAAKAMQGMIAQGGFNNTTDDVHDDALRCYEFADSMLIARKVE
jgi:hypothetical protein